MKWQIDYTRPQYDILSTIESEKYKYVIITKGRRFGLTKGLMNACLEWVCEGQKVLWGDTISSNIDRYWERYAMPEIKKANIRYRYNSQQKKANIGTGYIDFRSADRPENWEGFGYNKIFLNEAGIILKNDYLYTNAVLPMLIDYPNAQLIAGGVPKGKTKKNGDEHKFYTLYKNAKAGYKNYKVFEYTSYHNPLLSKEDIKDLEDEIGRMSPNMRLQEVYGQFVDGVEQALWVPEMIKHKKPVILKRIITAVDPAATKTGDEVGIITAGKGVDDNIYVLNDISGNYTPGQWGTIANNEAKKYGSDCIVIETNQGGDMAENVIRQYNKNIRIKRVHAVKAKEVRAEPVVSQYENKKVFHNFGLEKLENEMLTWVPGEGKSPNRVDALVYSILELTQNKLNINQWGY
jgi:phage terminase large subunit-like protein